MPRARPTAFHDTVDQTKLHWRKPGSVAPKHCAICNKPLDWKFGSDRIKLVRRRDNNDMLALCSQCADEHTLYPFMRSKLCPASSIKQ